MQSYRFRSMYFIFSVMMCLALIVATSNKSDAGELTGIYGGVSVGMSHYSAKLSEGGDSIDSVSADGVKFSIFAGGGAEYGNIYFGIEGNLAYPDGDFKAELNGNTIAKGDIDHAYGINARFGYIPFDRFLVYGLVGWQRVNLDMDVLNWSGDKDFDGIRFGAGLEYQTPVRVFFRGEYSYSKYSSERVEGVKIDPSSGAFLLSLGYRF